MAAPPMSFLVHAANSPSPGHPKQRQNEEYRGSHQSIHVTSSPAAKTVTIDYSSRGQWLLAAVLGANDGLVSVASLMIGVGAANQTSRAMLLSGLAGLVAGACSMAIGEFVSVYAQHDIEAAQLERDEEVKGAERQRRSLPSPFLAAAGSCLAFATEALLPLLAGAFVNAVGMRIAVVSAVTSLGFAGFGAAGAALGGASVGKSSARVLGGGWMAMGACYGYGVLRLFGSAIGPKPAPSEVF